MTTYVPNSPLVNYFFYNAPTTQGGPNIPLEEGKIYFYADEDHSQPLDTWSDVYDPNNPVVNEWPLRLGAAGECPIIYMEERFYYIEIYDKNDVFQRSISHYFPGDGFSGSANDAKNYIPNGQFLLHSDLPATEDYEAGEIREAITDIAYGGWTFERPEESTAKDFVTFERYDEYVSNPTGNPRYAVRIRCDEPDSGDAYKQLCVKFPNVNRFASAVQQYTFGFTGIDLGDADATVELYLIKNFGTDGSPQTETLLKTFTLTATTSSFYYAFVYGQNTGKIISGDDDDYIKLACRFKTDETIDLKLTDFLQESGNVVSPQYPETPNREDIMTSLGGGFPVPAYDGSNLYLHPILTPTGWEFDDSQVGFVFADTVLGATRKGYIDADGSEYLTNGYFSDGVPCSRLQSKYFDPVKGLPLYGTGIEFVTTYYTNDPTVTNSSLRIQNNKAGTATNYSDGSNPTGFTFFNVTAGTTSTEQLGIYYGNSKFYIWGKVIGAISAYPAIEANTSGFTVEQLRPSQFPDDVAATVLTKSLYSVTTVAASAITGGAYFTVYNTNGFYIPWYKKDGVGSQPSVPGAMFYIEIDIKGTWNASEIAKVTAAAISGSKITNIITTAASTIPQSSFFNLNTDLTEFYVWMDKDNGGTDPLVPGKTGIRVGISGAETAEEVGQNILLTLNSYSFAVPKLNGMILRGVDNDGEIDTDNILRWSFYNQLVSGDQTDLMGSYQFDEITQHTHYILNVSEEGFTSDTSPPAFISEIVAGGFISTPSGGSESRPLNMNVRYLVKY